MNFQNGFKILETIHVEVKGGNIFPDRFCDVIRTNCGMARNAEIELIRNDFSNFLGISRGH